MWALTVRVRRSPPGCCYKYSVDATLKWSVTTLGPAGITTASWESSAQVKTADSSRGAAETLREIVVNYWEGETVLLLFVFVFFLAGEQGWIVLSPLSSVIKQHFKVWPYSRRIDEEFDFFLLSALFRSGNHLLENQRFSASVTLFLSMSCFLIGSCSGAFLEFFSLVLIIVSV